MTATDLLTEAITSRSILIATDFDGTIAEITEHPDHSVANNSAVEALADLQRLPNVTIAVVSGRPHADLARMLPTGEPFTLIGEHGNDAGSDDPHPRLDALISAVSEVANDVSGSYVEVKKNSVGFHWRQADVDPTSAIERIEEFASSDSELRVLRGKMIIELSFGSRTKADAVLDLAVGIDEVAYFGDDVTDEDVFDALGPRAITVKVGDGPTSARFRVANVDDVVELLQSVSQASTSMTSRPEE